jgi:2-polyprenyl-3-methyl-5-hydroxy-6-metoxy-1,4-benzoquinol methylase
MQSKVEASIACALALSEKIKSGEYPTEDVKCFCGADADEVVSTEDRYGIPMQTVLCNECALVRVNPRLTLDAFKQFYNNEYRTLNHARYLTCNILSDEEERGALFERQEVKGGNLVALTVEQDIPTPKVVVDYGCHLGGMLVPWKKKFHSEVWGIEWDEKSAEFARAQGVNVVSSIEELIEKGIKADLVILQDVIEHFTDLRDVAKIHEIMSDEGYLYVYTPGLFRCNFHSNKQIAHTFYFCANTLHHVMNELGFAATYIDEDCTAFWKKDLSKSSKYRPPQEWVEFIRDEISGKDVRKMPPFSGICKFTKQELYDNMKANFAYKLPDLYELTQTRGGSIALINGGPSIEGQIEEIRKLKEQGAAVMAIARMYPWCVEHGITPDYVVSLDCMEEQEKGFEKMVPGVTYLLASVTRPSIVEMLKGEKTYIFDSRNEPKIRKLRQEAGYEVCSVVNGGGSVSICCLSLVFNIGFRDLHVFGLDLMMPSTDKTHAEGIAGKSVTVHPLPVTIKGKEILTNGAWLEFARQALDLISVAHQEDMLDSVKFYGESMINYMWDGVFHDEEEAA